MSGIRDEIRAARRAEAADQRAGTGQYVFPAGFSGFSGHFPGRPILPAVVQFLMGVDLASELSGRRLRLSAVRKAKFLRVVQPGEAVDVTLAETGKFEADVRLSVGDETAAAFRLILEEDA